MTWAAQQEKGDIWAEEKPGGGFVAVSVEAVARLFAGADGAYRFARWGRPLVPVLFGVEADTLAMFKAACGAVAALTRHGIAETDAEMGANLMVFFVRDWAELHAIPDMATLVPGIKTTVARLDAAGARQYRLFRFEVAGRSGRRSRSCGWMRHWRRCRWPIWRLNRRCGWCCCGGDVPLPRGVRWGVWTGWRCCAPGSRR